MNSPREGRCLKPLTRRTGGWALIVLIGWLSLLGVVPAQGQDSDAPAGVNEATGEGSTQPDAPSDPPEPEASPGKMKLQALADKVKAAGSMSYRVKFHAEGGLFAMGSPGVSQEVEMMRDPAQPTKWLIRYTGMGSVPSQGEFPINVVFRADKFEFADDKAKQVVARPQRSARNRQVDVALLGSLRALTEAAPLAKELATENVVLEDPKDVEGAMCDVVLVDPGTSQQKQRWYLAQADGLPRKYEVVFAGPKGDTSGLQVFELTGFALNEMVEQERFTLVIPEGYTDLRAPAVVPSAPQNPPMNTREGGGTSEGLPQPTAAPSAGPRPIGTGVGQMAPELDVAAMEGRFKLSEHRGKVVVLDFGGAWLQTSRLTGGPMKELGEKFGDKVVLVGLSIRDKTPEASIELWRQEKRSYTLVPGGDLGAKGLSGGDQAGRAYKVHAVPTIVVVGFQGEVLYFHEGFEPSTREPFPTLTGVIEGYLKDPKMPELVPAGANGAASVTRTPARGTATPTGGDPNEPRPGAAPVRGTEGEGQPIEYSPR